jgi:hypothetical protein
MTFRNRLPAATGATATAGFGDRGGNIMKPGTTLATILCLAVGLWAGDALAQQKQKVSYKVPAENTKYTKQLTIPVGDVPGHEIRISEIHRTFPTNAPMINGVRLKEIWSSNSTDWVDLNGGTNSYNVYVLENGDKFFTRTSTIGQNAAGKRANTSVGTVTGGTGKFVGMQGMVRASGTSDPKASGANETQAEIEYWFTQ